MDVTGLNVWGIFFIGYIFGIVLGGVIVLSIVEGRIEGR